MLEIRFHPKATKELLRIPKEMRLRILNKVAELQKLDHLLQHRRVIKLKGKRVENFRLRIGNYRIKLTLRGTKLILITHIQHRQVGY